LGEVLEEGFERRYENFTSLTYSDFGLECYIPKTDIARTVEERQHKRCLDGNVLETTTCKREVDRRVVHLAIDKVNEAIKFCRFYCKSIDVVKRSVEYVLLYYVAFIRSLKNKKYTGSTKTEWETLWTNRYVFL